MSKNKKTTLWHTLATEPYFGFSVGKVKVRTHDLSKCGGRNCVVHNPSDHHMRDWPTNFRADVLITERICPHGVGHPDPDDTVYQLMVNPDYEDWHGCDGCCAKPV